MPNVFTFFHDNRQSKSLTIHVTTTVESHIHLSSPFHATSPLTPPPPVYTSPIQPQQDTLADFFGIHYQRAHTRDSQPNPPPAYPNYDEPVTLARYMFMYGFIFFPFWLFGMAILVSPLHPTPEWEMGKTQEERTFLLN